VADSLTVLADPVQLESALLNIAINARDAMPAGGLLRFEAHVDARSPADLQSVDNDPVALDAAADGYVCIAVADNGSGMSEEVRERAFEPFFTTKAAGRGTGLGLSTVYGFVKQSRGIIEIASVPGKGTRISLLLPRPSIAAEPPPRETGLPAIAAGLRVLLVEDDDEVRDLMRRFLKTLGCLVQAAPSAEKALAMIDAGAAPDLLLTDIALGAGMRGTALAAEVQRRLPGARILLMSGFSAELLEADRDSPSTWELLPKPCTRQELGQAIARVMAHGATL
jgi:CheY-like chemotaxis protein